MEIFQRGKVWEVCSLMILYKRRFLIAIFILYFLFFVKKYFLILFLYFIVLSAKFWLIFINFLLNFIFRFRLLCSFLDLTLNMVQSEFYLVSESFACQHHLLFNVYQIIKSFFNHTLTSSQIKIFCYSGPFLTFF